MRMKYASTHRRVIWGWWRGDGWMVGGVGESRVRRRKGRGQEVWGGMEWAGKGRVERAEGREERGDEHIRGLIIWTLDTRP